LFLVGAIIFRILNALYWALVGGLGWGFGASIGNSVPFQGADVLGGTVGLACVMIGVLTINLGDKRSEFTPLYFATLGGAASGSASLLLLRPFGLEVNVLLGGGVGLFVGLCTSVMKQYFAPVPLLHACMVAVSGAALVASVGSLVGDALGWAAAGGISLCAVAVLTECLRRDPAVEIDATEQPIRLIPHREMCWHTLRQSWSLLDPLAWGWNGALGGLLASHWASWVADHPDAGAVRTPFLVCGSFAAVLTVIVRLGFLEPAKQW
jgi:hypothetical protein